MVSNSGGRIYFVSLCRLNALTHGYLQFQETGFDIDGGLGPDVPQMVGWRCDCLDLQSHGLGSRVLLSLSSVITCVNSVSAV